MRPDPAIFQRAHALLEVRLAHPHLTPLGRARITEELADLYRTAGRPAEAERAYRASLDIHPSARGEIFLAQSILFQGRAREADDGLRAIRMERLGPNEYEDYVFALAGVAAQLGDDDALADAERRLRAHKSTDPYFERRRLKLIVEVADAMAAGASAPLIERVRRLLTTPVRTFNRYIMAEPNINGMGFRVNNMLEDLSKARTTRARRKP